MLDSQHAKITIMVNGALCIALGEVLSKINLFTMPQGSSVDIGLMPLFLTGIRHTFCASIVAHNALPKFIFMPPRILCVATSRLSLLIIS